MMPARAIRAHQNIKVAIRKNQNNEPTPDLQGRVITLCGLVITSNTRHFHPSTTSNILTGAALIFEISKHKVKEYIKKTTAILLSYFSRQRETDLRDQSELIYTNILRLSGLHISQTLLQERAWQQQPKYIQEDRAWGNDLFAACHEISDVSCGLLRGRWWICIWPHPLFCYMKSFALCGLWL